jgi:hypothetical protein
MGDPIIYRTASSSNLLMLLLRPGEVAHNDPFDFRIHSFAKLREELGQKAIHMLGLLAFLSKQLLRQDV